MAKEGVTSAKDHQVKPNENSSIENLGNIEGKKCRAPHTHQWGHIAYHNAMICSVFKEDEEIKVSFQVVSCFEGC